MDFTQLRSEYDPKDFHSVLESFPQQFQKAYDYIEANPQVLKTDSEISKILVCGMGGSSLPTDIVNNICENIITIHTCRTYDVPEWIDQDTLVFVNSHSGNTEETLEALNIIQNITSHVVVITSGGKLLEQAQELELPVYIVESGEFVQPRAMSGYFMVYMLEVLQSYSLIENHKSQIIRSVNFLEEQNFEAIAKDIVEIIGDQLPIVYTSSEFHSVARIWKIKINENAKTQCFWNVFPELNHNEMVGFTNLRIEPIFIILQSTFDHPRVQKRMDIFAKLMEESSSIITIDMEGNSILEQVLWSMLLGDWTSYYLALSTETDPTPVDMVEDFKKLMVK